MSIGVRVQLKPGQNVAILGAPAINAALGDRLNWVAYPKAGQFGTDLNRDVLAPLVSQHGVGPVRHVAIDAVWSALRCRPATPA